MATFARHAEIRWDGDTVDGVGTVSAGTHSFEVPVTFPSMLGESAGKTTPAELLAASHPTCFGIGLRSLIGRRGGRADRITVNATITAEKGPSGIRILSSHLHGIVHGLAEIDPAQLGDIAHTVERDCTISLALRGTVSISSEVIAV